MDTISKLLYTYEAQDCVARETGKEFEGKKRDGVAEFHGFCMQYIGSLEQL